MTTLDFVNFGAGKKERCEFERRTKTASVSSSLCLIIRLTFLLRVSYFSFNSFYIRFSRQNPFELIVALSSSGEAQGGLFYDDGESLGKQKGLRNVLILCSVTSTTQFP